MIESQAESDNGSPGPADGHYCFKCRDHFHVEPYMEPTKYCHDCAHEVVDALEAKLAQVHPLIKALEVCQVESELLWHANRSNHAWSGIAKISDAAVNALKHTKEVGL